MRFILLFIFISRLFFSQDLQSFLSFVKNEYRLEFSNVNGEVSNSEWRDKIELNINPTFGDDFNNNYMNPR